MRFDYGEVYTHRNMLDCRVRIYRIIPRDTGISLLVSWERKDGFVFGIHEMIFITNAQLPNWRLVHEQI